jgi:hypothetical protein
MIKNVKYIIFEWPGRGEVPIIFPSGIYHWEIAKSIQSVFPGVSPVRAGFVGESYLILNRGENGTQRSYCN